MPDHPNNYPEAETHREGEAPAEPKPGTSPRLRGSVALPKRHHPAHGIKHVEGQPTIIFDTLCLKNRSPLLACEEFHAVFRAVAKEASAWLMGRYVIIPDHIHFFAADIGSDIPYENWIRYLKSQITKRYVGGRAAPGGRGSRRAALSDNATAPQERRPPNFGWLTDHWDTRVRSAAAYEEKWHYILDNPVRAGLVSSPGDWPFRGEIHDLRWD